MITQDEELTTNNIRFFHAQQEKPLQIFEE